MSREIKFRVYDVYNECYLDISDGINDGLLGVSTDGNYIFCLEDGEVQRYKTYDDAIYNDEGEEIFEKHCIYIIEWSTGLKDSNGVEIYEGNIIRWVDDHDENAYISFDEGCFWVSWPINSERINGEMAEDIEVIGNIHENAELLGGEK